MKVFKTYQEYLNFKILQTVQKIGVEIVQEFSWLWIYDFDKKDRKKLFELGFWFSKKRNAFYLPKPSAKSNPLADYLIYKSLNTYKLWRS
jgi:hypothetical protein